MKTEPLTIDDYKEILFEGMFDKIEGDEKKLLEALQRTYADDFDMKTLEKSFAYFLKEEGVTVHEAIDGADFVTPESYYTYDETYKKFIDNVKDDIGLTDDMRRDGLIK